MSGYLQRLISSVRAPRAAIRPAVPSPYAAVVPQATTPAFSAIEGTTVTRRPESTHRTDAQFPSVSREAHNQAVTEVSNVASQPPTVAEIGTRPEVHEPFFPPMAQAPPDDAPAVVQEEQAGPAPIANRVRGSSPTEPVGSADLGQPAERTPVRKLVETRRDVPTRSLDRNPHPPAGEKIDDNAEPNPVRTERPILRQEPFRPLMAEERPSLRAGGIATVNRMGSLPQRAVPTVPPVKPDTAPDEIQIHIGRIEVTALPPAPLRVAAPPLRKHLNLSEYLKRGSAS